MRRVQHRRSRGGLRGCRRNRDDSFALPRHSSANAGDKEFDSWCRPCRDSVPIFWAYHGLTSGADVCRPYGAGVGWSGLLLSSEIRFAPAPSLCAVVEIPLSGCGGASVQGVLRRAKSALLWMTGLWVLSDHWDVAAKSTSLEHWSSWLRVSALPVFVLASSSRTIA